MKGEFEKRICALLGLDMQQLDRKFGWYEAEFSYADLLKILDEAQKEFPLITEGPKMDSIPDLLLKLAGDRQKWFEKWFGGETEK